MVGGENIQKLELLAPNLWIILRQLIDNQKICKLIYYNSFTPLSEVDLSLPKVDLLPIPELNENGYIINEEKAKIYPCSFNTNYNGTETCQIRVYYPKVDFKNNEVIVDEDVYFDIVCAKNLWLISGSIRPIEIASEIFNIFSKNSISTVGVLHFITMRQLPINEEYEVIRMVARMMTL